MKTNRKNLVASSVAFTASAILLGLNANTVKADVKPDIVVPNAVVTEQKPAAEESSVAATAAETASLSKEETDNKEADTKPEQTATEPTDVVKGNIGGSVTPPNNNNTQGLVLASKAKITALTDETEETITGASQQTVMGEAPILGINVLTNEQIEKFGVSDEDFKDHTASLTWVDEPNTNKVGQHMGVAKLTYTDPTTHETKTARININIETRVADNKPAEKVRNRLTYVDEETNEVVASYSWIGDKNSPNTEFSEGNLIDSVDYPIYALGYGVDSSNDHSNKADLYEFGDADKSCVVFVKKMSKDPKTFGQLLDQAYDDPDLTYKGLNRSPLFSYGWHEGSKIRDAESLIGNISLLPEGTKISWQPGHEPKYDDNNNLSNEPVIQIEEPGKNPVHIKIKQGTDTAADANIMLNLQDILYSPSPQFKSGEIEVAENSSALNPADLLVNLDETFEKFTESSWYEGSKDPSFIAKVKGYLRDPQNWSWAIEPDLQKAGYTFGWAKFQVPKASIVDSEPVDAATIAQEFASDVPAMGIRIKVTPKTERTKSVTRTIIVTDPDGHETTINQVVTFTETGRQDLYGGDFVSTGFDNGTNGGTWDSYTAPFIDGYTAINSPVAEQRVNPYTRDVTIHISYSALPVTPITPPVDPDPGQPEIPDKPNDPDKQDEKDDEDKPTVPSEKHDQQKPITKLNKTTAKTIQHKAVAENAAKQSPAKQATLPQTGDVANILLAILGILTLGLSSILLRRRNNS